MDTLMMIDLEHKMREALINQLSTMCFEQVDAENNMLEIASSLAPQIWPIRGPETVAQMSALVADMPDLLTREPANIQNLRFDAELVPLTPLLLLHGNVIDTLMNFGHKDIPQLIHFVPLPPDVRQLYAAMRRRYVERGYRDQGSMGVLQVLAELDIEPVWRRSHQAYPAIEALIHAGLIEECGSREYRLSLSERRELIGRYRLEVKWPPYARSEIAYVMAEVEKTRGA